jgi:hypothetical protein
VTRINDHRLEGKSGTRRRKESGEEQTGKAEESEGTHKKKLKLSKIFSNNMKEILKFYRF